MNIKCVAAFAFVASVMSSSVVLAEQVWLPPAEIAPKAAQPTAPAAAGTSAAQPAAPGAAAAPVDKTKDCNAQADAKKLRGKARQRAVGECMKGK